MSSSAGTLGAGLVVGLAVGLGGGFLLFGSGGPGDGLGSDSGGLGGAELVAAADRPDAGGAMTAPSAAAPAPAPLDAPSGGFSSFGDALAAAARDAHRTGKVKTDRGNGEVSGRVMTDDGTPLSGVVIRAVRRRPTHAHPQWRPGDPAPPFNDLGRRVRERVAQREQRIADTIETTSDVHGRFRVPGLIAQVYYQLSAYAPGYEVRPVSQNGQWGRTRGNRGHSVRAGESIDLLAMPMTVVRVTLQMPDGTTAARATLTVQGTHASTQPWIPRDATLRLPPGSYKVRAQVPADPERTADPSAQEYRSEEVALEISHGTPETELTLTLSAQPGLAGTVTGFGGDPSAYIRVQLLKLGPGVNADKETLAKSNQNSWPRGNNPIYRFKRLEPGRYLIGAGHQRGEIEIMKEVEVSEGVAVVDFALTEPEAGDAMVVHATGPNGRPVGDITFWLSRRGRRANVTPGRRARTDDGGHRLDFPPHTFTPKPSAEPAADETPPGPWVLWGKSPLYGQSSVELSEGQRDVRLHLRAPAKLIVIVPGYAESALKGHITLKIAEPTQPGDESADAASKQTRWNRSSRWKGRNSGTSLDASGRYSSGPLEPGPRIITVLVAATKDRWSGMNALPAYTRTITLVSGDNRLSLPLPATHALNVQLDLGQGDARPSLQISFVTGNDGGSISWGNGTQADANGIVTFTRLPPGRYRLSRNHKQVREQMHVVVPAQERIRFIPEANDAMQVWLQHAKGLLGTAGLQQRDTIIEVDGKPFADSAAFSAAIRDGGDTVTLGYLRKGKQGSVTLDRERSASRPSPSTRSIN